MCLVYKIRGPGNRTLFSARTSPDLDQLKASRSSRIRIRNLGLKLRVKTKNTVIVASIADPDP
jgi:hypothetical protein